MLVNSTPAGWQIIYQQAHALLAAQLVWHWPPSLPLDQWVGLIAATAQHDDEQEAWHGHGGHHGLTPAGAPANFTQLPFSLTQARGVLRAAQFQGRWRSLLTAMHLSCLYEPLRGSKAEITDFLDELHQSQAHVAAGPQANQNRRPARLRPFALVRPPLPHPLSGRAA